MVRISKRDYWKKKKEKKNKVTIDNIIQSLSLTEEIKEPTKKLIKKKVKKVIVKKPKLKKLVVKARTYKITCPDGKFYIGSTRKKIRQRLKSHFFYKNTSLYSYCERLGYKMSDVKIECLKKYKDYETAESAEYKLLDKLKSDKNLLNKILKKPKTKLVQKPVKKKKRRKNTLSQRSRLALDRAKAELE